MYQMEPHLNKFSLNTLFQPNDFIPLAKQTISRYEPIYALMYLTTREGRKKI